MEDEELQTGEREPANRGSPRERAIIVGCILIGVVVIASCLQWACARDLSVEPSGEFGNIENGVTYDTAMVDLKDVNKVIVPDHVTVYRGNTPGRMRVFMSRYLSFYGHISEGIRLRDIRRRMGLATRIDGNVLTLSTYGEWDSHMEGGAGIKLVIELPEGLVFEQQKGLSGENSRATSKTGKRGLPGAWWGAPMEVEEGWAIVEDQPDQARRAK